MKSSKFLTSDTLDHLAQLAENHLHVSCFYSYLLMTLEPSMVHLSFDSNIPSLFGNTL